MPPVAAATSKEPGFQQNRRFVSVNTLQFSFVLFFFNVLLPSLFRLQVIEAPWASLRETTCGSRPAEPWAPSRRATAMR